MTFPGFGPPGVLGEILAGLQGLTMIDSTTASTLATITLPTDIEEGDFILIIAISYPRDTDYATPSGWTSTILNSSWTYIAQNEARILALGRISTGVESGDAIAIPNAVGESLGDNVAIALVFRGSSPITGFSFEGSTFFSGTSGNPSARTITSGSASGSCLAVGVWGAQSTVDPRSMSPAKDGEESITTLRQWVAWKFLSEPVNVVIDMEDESGFSNLGGFYVEFS